VQVVFVYLQWFRRSSLLKCVCQPKIEKKSLKPLFWDSRLFKVIDVGTPRKFASSACYDTQQVSVYLQPNSGEITILGGTPLWRPFRWRGISSHSSTKFAHRKLDTLGYHMVKTRSLYLTWAGIGAASWQTDRRTDGRTELRQIIRAKHYVCRA